MILSGIEIGKLVEKQSLISPFIEKNLRNSSYDLTVGDEIYCGSKHSLTMRTTYLGENESFEIPAYGLAYILCNENIKLPSYVTARVALRMSLIYKGLVLTVQPPFDPNYNGKVIIFLHNMSTTPVYLKRGERIATMEFCLVFNTKSEDIFDQPSVNSLQEKITHDVQSGLTDLVLKNNKNKTNYNIFFTVVIGVLGALIAIYGVFLSIAYNIPEKSFEIYKNSIDAKYAAEISSLNAKIENLEIQLKSAEILKENHNTTNSNSSKLEK
ncbi:hypothetical protein MU404_16500 [Acinetobacter baumannii]|uniref:dCTP deaminase domain-containing protein n=1 Tax=Acinetobacter baumannii TaxID=470 RepID=UPI0020BDE4F9|nr:hypothetical protein [Acinetobacter baumannii]MCL6184931.1 hypothetical protein [Acinetobacter baumannii]MCL6191830.1 hypothetical protein [Acinetobacter baumannii]